MLLILALLLFLIFGGLGFVLHVLRLGIVLAAIVAVAQVAWTAVAVPDRALHGTPPPNESGVRQVR